MKCMPTVNCMGFTITVLKCHTIMYEWMIVCYTKCHTNVGPQILAIPYGSATRTGNEEVLSLQSRVHTRAFFKRGTYVRTRYNFMYTWYTTAVQVYTAVHQQK